MDCGSLYLPKPTVEALGTRLGGEQWKLDELFGWLLTGRSVHATDGVVILGALIYLLLSS